VFIEVYRPLWRIFDTPKSVDISTDSCRLIYMSSDKMYTVKITSRFENNVTYVGRYETKTEAINASRWMKQQAGQNGRYYLAVPA